MPGGHQRVVPTAPGSLFQKKERKKEKKKKKRKKLSKKWEMFSKRDFFNFFHFRQNLAKCRSTIWLSKCETLHNSGNAIRIIIQSYLNLLGNKSSVVKYLLLMQTKTSSLTLKFWWCQRFRRIRWYQSKSIIKLWRPQVSCVQLADSSACASTSARLHGLRRRDARRGPGKF